MTSNVVELHPSKAAYIWLCGKCGCKTWFVRQDGELECPSCENISDAGWLELPAVSAETIVEEPNTTVVNFASHEMALRSVLVHASKSEACLVLVLRRDGHIDSWKDIETDEQREWLRRRIETFKEGI